MKEMWKRCLASALAALAMTAVAGDAVEPANVTFTNFRAEAEAYVGSETYFELSTLRMTNCVCYSGTDTNSAIQGLDGVTVTIDVGTTTTNVAYSGTVQVASNGTWYCDVTVPDVDGTPYVQVKITDASTNTYIYPWKILRTKASL